MVYAVLNAAGACINRIIWDGSTEWRPPVGCSVVVDPEGRHQIEPADQQTGNASDEMA